MSMIRSRTTRGISTYDSVVTSPATTTRPVVTRHSTATRLSGSWSRSASRTESLIWSAILSGCPSVTDSEVNSLRAMSSSPCSGAGRRCRAGVNLPGRAQREGLVPDGMGELVLATGQGSAAPLRGQQGDLAVRSTEDQVGSHRVQHQQVAPLPGQLRAAEIQQALLGRRGLRREADEHLSLVG